MGININATDSGGQYGRIPPLEFSSTKYACYTPSSEDFVGKFNRLLRKWRYLTLTSSSSDEILSEQEFVEIVSLGEKAIPLILDQIKIRPDHLVAALFIITGQDPVPAHAKGNFSEMANYWLDWYAGR